MTEETKVESIVQAPVEAQEAPKQEPEMPLFDFIVTTKNREVPMQAHACQLYGANSELVFVKDGQLIAAFKHWEHFTKTDPKP